MRYDNGISGNHQRRLAPSRVVNLGGVNRDGFLGRGFQHVFEGGKRFRERLGDGRRNDVELGEADLKKEKFRKRCWSIRSLLNHSLIYLFAILEGEWEGRGAEWTLVTYTNRNSEKERRSLYIPVRVTVFVVEKRMLESLFCSEVC